MSLWTPESGFRESLDRGDAVLWDNGYPGRWLAMGRGEGDQADQFFLAYSFGGRSDGSKNRAAVLYGTAFRLIAPGMTTEEMAQVPDAELIYYNCSDTKAGVFVVSNGAQTEYVLDAVVDGASFEEAVEGAPVKRGMIDGEEVDIDLSSYEPDAINTPRITGAFDFRPEAISPFSLAVVRKHLKTGAPIRTYYTADLGDIKPGEGWAIQTYGINDPNDRVTPVPHFSEAPYGFSMEGDTTAIAERVRAGIGDETFAAGIVRAIDVSSRQFNGHSLINTRG